LWDLQPVEGLAAASGGEECWTNTEKREKGEAIFIK